jgi:ribonuclease VapC
MIVDTSALVAILRDEDDASAYAHALAMAATKRISAGTLLETTIVVDANRDPVLSGRLDDLVTEAALEVVPVTRRHVDIARRAYRDFGRGSGHPAALNFGDCFAYALAREAGEPLLYKGEDFGHTDVAPVLQFGFG